MTTPLFLLRASQLGVSVRDIELLSVGLVLDMHAESANDSVEYDRMGDAADLERMLM